MDLAALYFHFEENGSIRVGTHRINFIWQLYFNLDTKGDDA